MKIIHIEDLKRKVWITEQIITGKKWSDYNRTNRSSFFALAASSPLPLQTMLPFNFAEHHLRPQHMDVWEQAGETWCDIQSNQAHDLYVLGLQFHIHNTNKNSMKSRPFQWKQEVYHGYRSFSQCG
jgi:hypothetical protein